MEINTTVKIVDIYVLVNGLNTKKTIELMYKLQ